MASQDPSQSRRPSLYPKLDDLSHPGPTTTTTTTTSTSSSFLYPSIDMDDLVTNLFPSPNPNPNPNPNPSSIPPSAPPDPEPVEETLITIPGSIVHLIDKHYSVELACGDFSLLRLRQGPTVITVLARVDPDLQFPLLKHSAAVRVDDSHYFFSLMDDDDKDVLNYGVTFASKGQEDKLRELDDVLGTICCFSVQEVRKKKEEDGDVVLDGGIARETRPEELMEKREEMEERSAAYWTTIAPNVEEYSGTAARFIAAGSGQLVRGILWCGDVTVERLKWGNEMLRKRMGKSEKDAEVSPETLKRIRRVKNVTKMTEKVANGVLSGVLKVSGFFTSKVANSKAGKKFFSMLPGEIVLASLDGFTKICDAAEIAGKNVMSTSSTVTTGLVSHRYGEDAGKATNEGLDAAGHAIGTAWAAFKIRKAFNPKSALKSSSLAKSAVKAAAAEYKSKKSSK